MLIEWKLTLCSVFVEFIFIFLNRVHPKHSLESCFEVGITQRVQNGIECAVEIAKPNCNGEYCRVDTLIIATIGHNHK